MAIVPFVVVRRLRDMRGVAEARRRSVWLLATWISAVAYEMALLSLVPFAIAGVGWIALQVPVLALFLYSALEWREWATGATFARLEECLGRAPHSVALRRAGLRWQQWLAVSLIWVVCFALLPGLDLAARAGVSGPTG